MSGAKLSGRDMKYPYTFTAKIVQFPVMYYFKHSWYYKYFVGGFLLSLPVFYKIHKLANSPGNVAAWEEIRRKEREEHH